MNTNNFRLHAEQQADIQAHEAWQQGRRPLPHVGHDPRFLRTYDGQGNVTLFDLEEGVESRPFRVHVDEREQQEWMRGQKSHRS
jgi:hypothetical protein